MEHKPKHLLLLVHWPTCHLKEFRGKNTRTLRTSGVLVCRCWPLPWGGTHCKRKEGTGVCCILWETNHLRNCRKTVSIQSDAVSNVAVIIVRIVFISLFFFYCLLLNHSFPTNPNKITNCFKLFLFYLQLYKLHLLNAFVYFWFLIIYQKNNTLTEKEKEKMKNNNKPDLTILQQIEQLKIQRMKEMRSNKNKRNSGSTTSFTPKSSLTSKDNSAKDENNKFKNGKYSKRRRACIAYMEAL